MSKKKPPTINLSPYDFGIIAICAVRYSLGRQSYMPGLVQGIVRPRLKDLSDKDLFVIERDVSEADKYGGYGHPTIDKPDWLRFLSDIRLEQERRKAHENL